MPKNQSQPTEELLPADPDRWTVVTKFARQNRQQIKRGEAPEISHHELLFGHYCQMKKRGESGLESLREMARFLNKRNLQPRPQIQCAADAPSPEAYLKKIHP